MAHQTPDVTHPVLAIKGGVTNTPISLPPVFLQLQRAHITNTIYFSGITQNSECWFIVLTLTAVDRLDGGIGCVDKVVYCCSC